VGNSGSFAVAATGTAPLSYQWQKNGVAIPGATLATYVTPPTRSTDDGSIFVALVSNPVGSIMSSPAMLNVVAGTSRLNADAATLSFGNVIVGSNSTMSVTLANSGNASANISGVSVSPQAFTALSSLAGATVAPGQSVSFGIQFTPPSQAAFSGTITVASDATNSPISIPVSGTGVAPPAHSVGLSWTPSSTPNIAGYLIERGDQSGGPYTSLTPNPIPATTYTDTTVVGGHTYFYVIIAVDSTGLQSPPSNEAAVTIPSP
jgi:Abnormal spindle-like microcephaly-assoc'd, ASPM-SPD-2-Hydin